MKDSPLLEICFLNQKSKRERQIWVLVVWERRSGSPCTIYSHVFDRQIPLITIKNTEFRWEIWERILQCRDMYGQLLGTVGAPCGIAMWYSLQIKDRHRADNVGTWLLVFQRLNKHECSVLHDLSLRKWLEQCYWHHILYFIEFVWEPIHLKYHVRRQWHVAIRKH